MKTLTLFFIGMLFFMQVAYSQIPEVTWERAFPVKTSYYFSDVQELPGGNLILLGAVEQPGKRSFDLWLLELNSNGDTIKTKMFENTGKDIPMRILVLGEKGYMLAFLNETGEKTYRSYVMSVGPDFTQQWVTGAEKPTAIVRSDIAADNTGHIWWLNTVSGADGNPQVSLCKLDEKGNVAGEVVTGSSNPAEGYALKTLPDGTIALPARILPPGQKSFVQVMRMDNAGEVLWKTIIPDANKSLTPQCLCCSPDNYLLLGGWAGLCYNPDAPVEEQIWDYDYLLSKIDPSGNVLWTQNYNREGSEKGTAVAVLPNGNIMAAGKCETSFTGSVGPWLLLVDVNGNKIQDQIYKFRFVKDQVARIITTKDGGLLMVGPGYVDSETQLSGWMRKLNPVL
ncbi:MAG: hypothetical protein ACOC0R_01910 [Mariniphaga sp.]